MSKPEKREQARAFRQSGKSLKEISKQIGCPPSSISRWVRDVKLTREQQKYLDSLNPAKKNGPHGLKGSMRNAVTWHERRLEFQEEGRRLARKADKGFIAGIMLYWAEGARSKNRNSVKFSNTSAPMVRFFVSFLKRYFGVENNEICVSVYCHLNNGFTLKGIEEYWLKELGLEEANLRKAYVEQKRKVSGIRTNIHPYGVCNIAVHSTETIQKIYGAIQEYVGFDEAKWV